MQRLNRQTDRQIDKRADRQKDKLKPRSIKKWFFELKAKDLLRVLFPE